MKQILLSIALVSLTMSVVGCGRSNEGTGKLAAENIPTVTSSTQQKNRPKILRFNGKIANAFIDQEDAKNVESYLFGEYLIAPRNQFLANAKSASNAQVVGSMNYQNYTFDIIEYNNERMLLVDDILMANLTDELFEVESVGFTTGGAGDSPGNSAGSCASSVIGGAINGALTGAAAGAAVGVAVGGPAGAAAGAAVGGSAGAVGGALSAYGSSPSCGHRGGGA